jgi:hypothetical protein
MGTLNTCKTCEYWDREKNNKIYGKCTNKKVSDKLAFGYTDDWSFHRDFGCIFWKKKEIKK